jgi:hypothetical protein
MRPLSPILLLVTVLGALSTAAWAQKYTGPRPPEPDMIYLVHADNLVPTEVTEAKQESKKNEFTYTISGANSSARTPLAEPIFLIQSTKIQPDRIELYRMEVKNGHREVTMVQRRTRGAARPLRLTVTRLDGGLYRIEASETLENGEYSLSPSDSNRVFCFEVY